MNNIFDKIRGRLTVDIRERTNLFLGDLRRKKLCNEKFTILSNNCWGGHFYRYFNLPYLSPTIGMYFFSEDYIKFLSNIKKYLAEEVKFITYQDSRYKTVLEERGGENVICPIAVVDDIEIIFLHYSSKEEALEKWRRRIDRICWDNIIVKNSEMNFCSQEHVLDFDKLPFQRKFIFTVKDYGIRSQIIWKSEMGNTELKDDTTYFRKYIDPISLINGRNFL